MNRCLLLVLLITISSSAAYAQNTYKPGYFIDNSGNKVDCFIKDIDPRKTPQDFKYSKKSGGESEVATTESIKEFGLTNGSKYIRASVSIDQSSDDVNRLSKNQNPEFVHEVVFVKTILEGKANLYEYIHGNLFRYFYSTEQVDSLTPLVYKRYKKEGEIQIRVNYGFRQQLWNELNCETIALEDIDKIEYKKKDLVKYFTEYSSYNQVPVTDFDLPKKENKFHISIRPRYNNTQLEFRPPGWEINTFDMGADSNFGLGLEFEYVLPFYNKKWSISTEPTYQSYESEKTVESSFVVGGTIHAKTNYSSIEVPLTLRYSTFLNSKSKLFANASVLKDFSIGDSNFSYQRADGTYINQYSDFYTNVFFGFGAGVKALDKFSLELAYQTDRELLSDYYYGDSKYTKFSAIVGYTLF